LLVAVCQIDAETFGGPRLGVGAEFGSKHSVSCHPPGRDTGLAMTVEGEAPIVRWLNDAIGMQSPREE